MSELFAPATAWFPTVSSGWAIGTVPCTPGGTTLCVTGTQTSDGGLHWVTFTPPPLLDVTDPGHHAVLRMTATGEGLVSDGRPGSPLWSTDDGGSTWTALPLPGVPSDAQVTAIALGGGRAYVVAGDRTAQRLYEGPVGSGPLAATSLQLGGVGEAVDLATKGGRTWVADSPGLPGRDPALWASTGGTSWSQSPIPCGAGSTARIAASDSRHLVLGCQGTPSGPDATKAFFTSADGGVTFAAGAHLAPDGFLTGVAAASRTVVVGALSSDNDLLVRSGDGGGTFVVSFASQAAGTGQGLYDLTFPDSTRGYVVLGSSGAYAVAVASGLPGVPPPRLLTTGDGGGHWTQVSIGR